MFLLEKNNTLPNGKPKLFFSWVNLPRSFNESCAAPPTAVGKSFFFCEYLHYKHLLCFKNNSNNNNKEKKGKKNSIKLVSLLWLLFTHVFLCVRCYYYYWLIR